MIILRQHRGVRLANERYEEIKADIIDMFEECDVHTFPLNAFDIAETLHYNVVPYSSLPVEKRIECHCISKDGCSELDYNQETGMYTYNIYYNDSSDIDDSRVHFTIMHEIGHIRLGHLDEDIDKPDNYKESEANFYAAYSLAPPPMIDYYACANQDDLCRTFHVSWEMSGYCLDRYVKWLSCSPYYTEYETQLMSLFGAA